MPLRVRAVLVAILVGVVAIPLVCAQAPPGRLRFEVASVKPTEPTRAMLNQRPVLPGGRYVGVIALTNMILTAYKPDGIQRNQQIIGLSPALSVQYFSIRATVGDGGPTDVEGLTKALPELMRSLLEDRFKLSAHTETRNTQSYSITVARNDGRLGPSLRRSSIDCAARREHPTADAPACGVRFTPTGVIIAGTPMDTIAVLANTTAARILHAGLGGMPVRNDTNLEGLFDAEIDLSAEIAASGTSTPTPAGAVTAMTNVYRDQLGLRISTRQDPTNVLVIDHVERPTED